MNRVRVYVAFRLSRDFLFDLKNQTIITSSRLIATLRDATTWGGATFSDAKINKVYSQRVGRLYPQNVIKGKSEITADMPQVFSGQVDSSCGQKRSQELRLPVTCPAKS
jgi:hypothetical protein